MNVFIVMKNSDFTEGRGAMVFHRVFSTLEKAQDYVESKSGIFGSSQYTRDKVKLFKDTYNYNGYGILIANCD